MSIIKKLRLAFQLPPKPPPVRKRTPYCPHCGKTTLVMTEKDAQREREKIKNYKF